ncbi:heavy metal translocating P-type ATPase [Enterococcus ratti]|uniref:Cd(2+)-exporting ATPase n=1 Tax=Enterococcus ratti TaxID=150033 RepID=A0A1L8WPS6_9ENTE|nr:heavy metal translocating P-type ATPase [Enterococcus ratti]OJG83025.1 heavy metal translocating P-type ATPase [Enterococcus ratti]
MKSYHLIGLDCANCAMKIEKKINEIKGIKQVNVNFATGKLTIEIDEKNSLAIEKEVMKAINEVEPEVKVTEIKKERNHLSEEKEDGKEELVRIVFSTIGLMVLFIGEPVEPIRFIGFLLIYLLIGFDVIKRAGLNIIKGQLFDENFLMAVATIGAMVIGEYPEAVAVMLFYQVGEYFQSFAVKQSRKSIRALMEIRPEVAHVETKEGIVTTQPENVAIGERVLVKPGERVPLDGKVITGQSLVDTSALTGESVPKEVIAGETVLSGFINKTQPLLIKVEKNYENSTVSKLLELVENASNKKAPAENFITKFARYYTPVVVGLAVLLAIVPPLILSNKEFYDWIYRALTFLVISCPCALVISVPLSFFAGIGGASKIGVLVKGGNYLEQLAHTDTFVFDKTGTLTKGDFSVQKVETAMDESQFMQYVASVEQFSTHPIAQAILAAYKGPLLSSDQTEEILGEGIRSTIDNQRILVGNSKLLTRYHIDFPINTAMGTLIYVAIDEKYVGCLIIADTLKNDAKEALKKLKKVGIKQTMMLTGDAKEVAAHIGKELAMNKVYSELLPQDKVTKLEQLMDHAKVAFVGDGINDAPVLARADVGIAMGGLGSDAAIDAADVVIMNDEPSKIAEAIRLSRKTLKIVKQNIIFAIGIKILVLVLGAFGIASMGDAVFADVGVTVLAVLNAMRCLQVER